MGKIFMSYRRADAQGYAPGLYDRLSGHFGAENVVRDLDSIPAGADFERFIEEAVDSCDVLVALIGPDWLAAQDSAGRRRLDQPHDYVRLEIGKALARSTPVIPVLLNEAQMPPAAELPLDLAPLATRNAVPVSDSRWAYDVERLLTALETYTTPPAKGMAAPPGGRSPGPWAGTPPGVTAVESRPTRGGKGRWTRPVVATAAVILVAWALLVLWALLLKPTVKSTAREAPSTPSTVTREAVGTRLGRNKGLTLTVAAIREMDRKDLLVDMAVDNSTGDTLHLDVGNFSMVDDTGKSYEPDRFDFTFSWPTNFPPGHTTGTVKLKGPLQPQAQRVAKLGFGTIFGTLKLQGGIYVTGIPLGPAKP